MTAVKSIVTVTRFERQQAERREWIADVVGYSYMIGLFAQDEMIDAVDLAESLYHNSVDEGGELLYTPQESLDEELTYWGE